MTQLWCLELGDTTSVAMVYADDARGAIKLRPRTFKAKEITARRVVHIECSSARLYRWLCIQASPYVARHTSNGFIVRDEGRWSAMLSAAEGREITEGK